MATATETDATTTSGIAEEKHAAPALGRDPFTELAAPEPFLERLRELTLPTSIVNVAKKSLPHS